MLHSLSRRDGPDEGHNVFFMGKENMGLRTEIVEKCRAITLVYVHKTLSGDTHSGRNS